MVLNNVSIELLALCLLVAVVVIGLLAVLLVRGKSGRGTQQTALITATIIDYFRRSGVEVTAGCVSLDGNKRYTAFIESEPMKRFRLSHIIEATLSEHILSTCNLELDKIYWRFPIKEGVLPRADPDEPARDARDNKEPKDAPAASAAKASETNDDYINEGLVHYKHLPKLEATEMSWEKFQEVSTMEASRKPEQ